jgi:hypothetical protein
MSSYVSHPHPLHPQSILTRHSKVAMSRSNKSLATVRLPDGKTDLLYYYDADNNLAQYMIAEGSAEGVSQTVLLNGKEIPGPGTIVGANPSNHLAACGGSFKGVSISRLSLY